MKIEPGTQRAIGVLGEDAIGVMDHLQGWIDEGWRCVALASLAETSAIAILEAGAECYEADDNDDDDVTEDELAADAENENPAASAEGWSSINSIADLWIRCESRPDAVIDLRAGPPGGGLGIVRLREGARITQDLIARLQDLLIAADEAHTARMNP